MNENRGSWYLLTGIVFGLILGLLFAWVISPLAYVDTTPATLRKDYKDAYRLSVSLAYLATGDVERARARLALLEEDDSSKILAEQAQQYLAEGRPVADIKALGLLAAALRQTSTPKSEISLTPLSLGTAGSPTKNPEHTQVPPQSTQSLTTGVAGMGTLTQTSGTPPSSTRKPTSTNTPLPTLTPSPTLGSPFVLAEKKEICDPKLSNPLIQVEVVDAADVEVPGVTIIINWDDSEEKFFTGMKPEIGIGFADYAIMPGVTYMIHIAEGGEPVKDLVAHECENEQGERYWGGWFLKFTQP